MQDRHLLIYFSFGLLFCFSFIQCSTKVGHQKFYTPEPALAFNASGKCYAKCLSRAESNNSRAYPVYTGDILKENVDL